MKTSPFPPQKEVMKMYTYKTEKSKDQNELGILFQQLFYLNINLDRLSDSHYDFRNEIEELVDRVDILMQAILDSGHRSENSC